MNDILWTPKKLDLSEEDFTRINQKPIEHSSIFYNIKDGFFGLTRPESLGDIGQLFT